MFTSLHLRNLPPATGGTQGRREVRVCGVQRTPSAQQASGVSVLGTRARPWRASIGRIASATT
eukprot:3580821-Rhodomonas_salina.1